MRSLKKRSALKNEDPLIAGKTTFTITGPPFSEKSTRQREKTLFFVSEQKKGLFLVSQSEIKEMHVAG